MDRVLLIVVCFGLALFFIYKMVTSKPYHLKKKDQIRIVFRKDIPLKPKGEFIKSLLPKRIGNLVVVLLSICVLAFLVVAFISTHDFTLLLFMIPTIGFGIVQYLYKMTLQIDIYEFAIVFKSLLSEKKYHLHDIDTLESYNVVNIFNKGSSYGYRLKKNNEMICQLDKRDFKNIDEIEIVFSEKHPSVAEIVSWEIIDKPL